MTVVMVAFSVFSKDRVLLIEGKAERLLAFPKATLSLPLFH
jgi:hypothetical protein